MVPESLPGNAYFSEFVSISLVTIPIKNAFLGGIEKASRSLLRKVGELIKC